MDNNPQSTIIENEVVMQKFRTTVNQLKKQHGLSTAELARLAGVGKDSLYKVLSNRIATITTTEAGKIAKVFDMPIDALIGNMDPVSLDILRNLRKLSPEVQEKVRNQIEGFLVLSGKKP